MLSAAACALLLGACETIPEPGVVGDPLAAWSQHREGLEALADWSANGRLGVRSETDSFTARVQWDQSGDSFRIRLSSPLGQGLAELTGVPGAVVMRTAENRVYRAASADELLARELGWEVPLDGLRYWMLGRESPATRVKTWSIDETGRLATIDQLGWQVEYDGYRAVDGIDLPIKLVLHHPRLSARVVVSRWRL